MTIASVVEKHYQFILWMLPKLAKYPRDQRFLLADRVERCLLDILNLLLRAAYSREKKEYLAEANFKLEETRYLLRISRDMKYLRVSLTNTSSTGLRRSATCATWTIHSSSAIPGSTLNSLGF